MVSGPAEKQHMDFLEFFLSILERIKASVCFVSLDQRILPEASSIEVQHRGKIEHLILH